ncbi:hypothetical protein DCAR_0832870 [Daucus carota subsp. sativus]|uniref:Ubiquitin-like domain-containing protein n=1 Tax=Daucus carota subsp. sativus TaxID=79200 RepID=A0AAF0XSV6_DAUCS|nr:hypothetical protein DCAR_0832870 [Daucus carota subsp. sativus]
MASLFNTLTAQHFCFIQGNPCIYRIYTLLYKCNVVITQFKIMITKWIRDEKSEVGVWVGQMPLCRQVPKLRGNAGVNLKDIAAAGVQEGEEVSLESLENKDLINPSGRQTKETSCEGDGDLSIKLNFKARAFPAAAKMQSEAISLSLTTLPGRKKWAKPSVSNNHDRTEEYFAKKRASPEWFDPSSV